MGLFGSLKAFFQATDWKDVGLRAVKTFFQATVAALIIPATDAFNLGSWKAAALGAGAAGVSAVWNGVIKPLIDKFAKS